MSERIVAVVSFSGLSGPGIIDLSSAGPSGTLAGDRVSGVTNISTGQGSAAGDFGSFLTADEILVQTANANLSSSRFVAVITRPS